MWALRASGSIFAVALSTAAGLAVADDWRGTAGVSGGLIWTDNVFLSATDPQSDAIFQIRPFISATRAGNRVRATFNYGPSILLYTYNPGYSTVQHVLDARADAELIERYFFIDIVAQANQALVSPESNAGFDAVAGSGAYTQTASISITPRIDLPVLNGDFAVVRIQPGLGAVFTADTANDGGQSTTGVSQSTASITSGPRFQRVPWSLSVSRNVFDSSDNQQETSFSAAVSYVFNARYRVTAIGGYDDGTYVAEDGRSQGARWQLQFLWTPKPTSSLLAGFGQAFYGNFAQLSLQHRHKRWAFFGGYDVSIQNAATTILNQDVVPLVDAFGQPIRDPILGDVLAVNSLTPVLIDDTFLQEQWNAGVAYSRGRSTVRWDWFGNSQDYAQSSNLDSTNNQWRLSFTRRMTPKLTGTASLRYWDYTQSTTQGYSYEQTGVELGLRYRLGSRTSLGTRLWTQHRDGSQTATSFSENRVTLDVQFQL